MPVEKSWWEIGCEYKPKRWKRQQSSRAGISDVAGQADSARGETPELATEIE